MVAVSRVQAVSMWYLFADVFIDDHVADGAEKFAERLERVWRGDNILDAMLT